MCSAQAGLKIFFLSAANVGVTCRICVIVLADVSCRLYFRRRNYVVYPEERERDEVERE